MTLVDQFNKKTELPTGGSTQIILSFEKSISIGIKEFLNKKNKNFLSEHNLTYISDISTVPSLALEWFAIPKMQKFAFQILLINDKNITNKIDKKENKVSLFRLIENTIIDIKFIEIEELKEFFK